MIIEPVPPLDIQFGNEYDAEKVKRLVQRMQKLQKTVNTLVTLINTGQIIVTQTTPPTPNP